MLLLTFSLSKQKRSALLRSSQYLLYSIQLDLLFSKDNGKKDELLLSYLHCFPDIFPLLLTLSLYSSPQRKSGKEKEKHPLCILRRRCADKRSGGDKSPVL